MSVLTITPNPSTVGDTVAVATVATLPSKIEYGNGNRPFNNGDWTTVTGSVAYTADKISLGDIGGAYSQSINTTEPVTQFSDMRIESTYISGARSFHYYLDSIDGQDGVGTRAPSTGPYLFLVKIGGTTSGVAISGSAPERQIGDHLLHYVSFRDNAGTWEIVIGLEIRRANNSVVYSGTTYIPFPLSSINNLVMHCGNFDGLVEFTRYVLIPKTVLPWSLTQDNVEIDSGTTTGGAISYDHTTTFNDNGTDWKYTVAGVDSNIVTMLVEEPFAIIDESISPTTLLVGETVTAYCETSGATGSILYELFIDDPAPLTTPVLLDSITTTNTSVTFLHTAVIGDDGQAMYIKATNAGNEIYTRAAVLSVEEQPPVEEVDGDKPRFSPEFSPSQTVGFGDIRYDEATMDLSLENGLDSTFFLAVYSEARATENDELPNDDDNRRGWWGDEILELSTGNRSWLYAERGKLTADTILKIQDSMREAVDRQMIETGLIDDVDISYELKEQGVEWKVLLIRYTKTSINLEYLELWDGQIDKITKERIQ